MRFRLLLIIALSWSALGNSFSQDTLDLSDNPFALPGSLDSLNQVKSVEELKQDALNEQKPVEAAHESVSTEEGNPFALNPSGAKTPDSKVSKTPTAKPAENKISKGSLLFSIIVLLSFLTMIVSIYRSEISKEFNSFISTNAATQAIRENWMTKAPSVLLYLHYFASGGIFLFLVVQHFNWLPPETSLTTLLLCIATLIGIYILRHLFLLLVSVIYPFGNEVRLYNFMIVNTNKIIGLILIPFIFFIAFSQPNIQTLAVNIALVSLVIIFVYRSIRGLLVAGKHILFHRFHFFIYLCTVEIAPALVLLKILMR